MKRYRSRTRHSRQRQRSRRRSLSLLARIREPVVLLNHRGQLVGANRLALQTLNLSHRCLIGRYWKELVDTSVSFSHVYRGHPVQNPKQYISLRRPERSDHLSQPSPGALLQKQQIIEWSLTYEVMPGRHLIVFRDISDRSTQAEADLAQQQQKSELFADVTLKIRQSLQLKEILEATVTEVQRLLQADRVLVYQVLKDGTGKPISEAVLPAYPQILGMQFPEEVFPTEYQQRYAQGRIVAIANVRDPAAGLAECLVEFVEQFGIKAKLIVPILQNPVWQKSILPTPPSPIQSSEPQPEQLWGLLIAHQCQSSRQWTDAELALMKQLANQISIAIAQAQLVENLEEIVEVRTMALRQQEEQLRLITNALPVLIGYIDRQQRYQFNNQAYEDWLDQPLASLQGRHLKEIWGAETYQQMQSPVKEVLSGKATTYENTILGKDGKERSLNITYIPDLNDQGEVQGFFALTSDISDRKAIERMKDEFISVVSHELRTPLTSMHSALKILSTGRLGLLSEDGQQMLEIADENTERLVRLVNNVLDLQRIESGEVTMEQQTCNVADLITRAVEAMMPMAQQQQIQLNREPQNLSIWADADYILQALTNLLSNAIKFSSAGDVVNITTDICEGQVLFQICDQGPGIPADKLESIFERFQQVDSSDARRKGGTGLGLTICREIIEQHGGKIWAESHVGQGSKFLFTVPFPPEDNPPQSSKGGSNPSLKMTRSP